MSEPKQDINEKLELLQKTLREAQEIADKNGLSFRVSLDLPEGNNKEGHPGYRDYHYPTFSATYHGTGNEVDEHALEDLSLEEYNKLTEKDYPRNKEGYWSWHNSSMNC